MTATTAKAAGKLTRQQRRAIEERDVSVALSAGAGCGKTHVLTERFLSHLDPSFDAPGRVCRLPELVAITFTDRAAREMRDRIRNRCYERLRDATQEHEIQHWANLVRELDAARVSTIHSFCGSLLRTHAVEAGIDPRFRTLEQNESITLQAEVLDDELRRLLVARDRAAIELVVRFGLDGVRRQITQLLEKVDQIDFDAWLARSPDEIVERWAVFYQQTALPLELQRVANTREARTVREIAQQERPTHPKLRERFETLAEAFDRVQGNRNVHDALRVIWEHARVEKVACKHWPSPDVYEQFKNAAGKLREGIKKFDKRLDFDVDAARPSAEAGLQLLQIVRPVAEAYAAKKRELGCLDFNDLLARARDLLMRPGHERLRQQVSSHIRLLLVDEFQDTDPLQVELVKAVCDGDVAGGKLFFVGDYKQSIYRFRRADPQVFRALSSEIPKKGRLPLTENFRSQPAVLKFVNALFCEAMGDDYEPLVPHREQVSPEPAVEFLWAPVDADAHPKPTVDEIRAKEADWLARRLRQLHDSREPLVWDREAADKGKPAPRPVEWGDMALLFRALSNVQQYEEALRRYGIPYYLVGGHAFYSQQEVFDLLNLLRSINSPSDEISLAGVLRSPFFCLSDESLFWLSQHPEGLSSGIFTNILPSELDAQQRERVRFAAQTLKHLRTKKDRVPIAELIEEALAMTGYDGALVAEFLGERKLANLQKLIDQARLFDRSAMFTLADFILQLSEFVANQPKEALAATHAESTNVVKLMTIHLAKGLEFPVVAVPDLGRRLRGDWQAAAFHQELGPLVKFPEGDQDRAVCGLDLYNTVESVEEEAERIRLLYVATTRAADYLILSSGVEDLDKPPSPWMQLLAERFDLRSGRLLANIPAGYQTPQVRVTMEAPPEPGNDSSSSRRLSLEEIAEQAAHLAQVGDCAPAPYCGPVPPDFSARRQFSFSRLHGQLKIPKTASEAVEPVPAPLPTVQVDALELGTLVHAVLADIPFGQNVDLAALVQRHAMRQMLDAATEAEARRLVARFLQSPRAAALASAQVRLVEQEFLLAWPPGAATAESRYLQGFIDCLYQDAAGKWHVLDYKTNQVDAATLAATVAEYEMQMLVYALAVEQILGQPPASVVLHFLRPGLEHQFQLDGKARRKLTEMVNRSISALVREDELKQTTLF